MTTASGTDVSAAARGGPTTPGLSSAGGGGGAGEGVGGKGGSAPGAFGGGPALADDASVLPVPNHVVLHHLSTSAIKNGVLAVGNTTRYKKKVGSRSLTLVRARATEVDETDCLLTRLDSLLRRFIINRHETRYESEEEKVSLFFGTCHTGKRC